MCKSITGYKSYQLEVACQTELYTGLHHFAKHKYILEAHKEAQAGEEEEKTVCNAIRKKTSLSMKKLNTAAHYITHAT